MDTKVLANVAKRRPPAAGIGRKKGVPNKTTASVKAALCEAFEQRGGVPALLKWANAEPTEFYKLWGKMLPKEIVGSNGGPISVVVRVAREGKRRTAG
jgi:hypothetical protein